MLRTSEPILDVLDPATYEGPLGPLFAFGRKRWFVLHGEPRPYCSSLLVDLQLVVNKCCAEDELLPVYKKAIELLRRVLSMLYSDSVRAEDHDGDGTTMAASPTSLSFPKLEAWDIFLWVWHTAPDFVPLLKGSKPKQEAVAIYAHFLVMLKKLEGPWWLEGWARHMIERVWVLLDQEHRLWIQWPVEELGWIPPRRQFQAA